VNAESVEQNRVDAIPFYHPKLSNPPEEVATVAADFWHPEGNDAVPPPRSPKQPQARTPN